MSTRACLSVCGIRNHNRRYLEFTGDEGEGWWVVASGGARRATVAADKIIALQSYIFCMLATNSVRFRVMAITRRLEFTCAYPYNIPYTYTRPHTHTSDRYRRVTAVMPLSGTI